MEPPEISRNLLFGNLQQLVFITGLDVNSNIQHASLFGAFIDNSRERIAMINYKVHSLENGSSFIRKVKTDRTTNVLKKSPKGILRCHWPLKYLNERPALVIHFLNIDIRQPLLPDKRAEYESKISSIRQSIDVDVPIFVILDNATPDNKLASQRMHELSSYCGIPSRQIAILPPGEKKTDIILRLERTFNDLIQETYQVFLKKIRSRNVPNNNPYLLISQQYKMAFISELRMDTHSALRYYKQAYHNCSELDVSNCDAFEVLAVASLLNLKICEMAFLHNNASDAMAQIRRHENLFFSKKIAPFPRKDLAAIEFTLWKSQQCRLFADQFVVAIQKDLAAYSFQNPGRFLENSSFFQRHANKLIRELRERLASSPKKGSAFQEISNLFGQNFSTEYYGQRPWKMVTEARAMFPSISVLNDLQIEHAAINYLENNIRENYSRSTQLLSSAIAQYKKYGCKNMQQGCFVRLAEDYIFIRDYSKAHQIFLLASNTQKPIRFSPVLGDILIRLLFTSYCLIDFNEYMLTLSQLLNSNIFENENEPWIEVARNFISNEFTTPFIIPFDQINGNFLNDEIDAATQKWRHFFKTESETNQLFNVNLGQINELSFVQCTARFVIIGGRDQIAGYTYSGDPVLAEVTLKNLSNFPINFSHCQLLFETNINDVKTTSQVLDEYLIQTDDGLYQFKNLPFHLLAESTKKFYFCTRANLELDTVRNNYEKYITIRKVTLSTVPTGAGLGNFYWEFDRSIVPSPLRRILLSHLNDLTLRTFRVVPIAKHIPIRGPEEIKLFLDEYIEIPFEVENNFDCALGDVKILADLVYDDENSNLPASLNFQSDQIISVTSTVVLDTEVTKSLTKHQSVGLRVRLHPITINCKYLRFKIDCSMIHEDRASEFCQSQKIIPVKCDKPFASKVGIYSDKDGEIFSLTNGQYFIVSLNIEQSSLKPSTIRSVDWKFYSDYVIRAKNECIFGQNPSRQSGALIPQRQKSYITHLRVLPDLQLQLLEISIGECLIEWLGEGSTKPTKTVIDLGKVPFVAIPFTLEVGIRGFCDGEELTMRRPFVVRFTFQNFTESVISLHVVFESSDVFVFTGSKEIFFHLFGGVEHVVDQTFVALAAGPLPFPQLTIRCTDICHPEFDAPYRATLVESTNQLIQAHTLRLLPPTLFIMN